MCNIFYDWILHLLKKLKPWKCLKLLHWCETGWLDPLTKWSLFSILSSLQLKKRGTSSFQPALSLPLLLNVLFNERLVLPMPLTNRVANKALSPWILSAGPECARALSTLSGISIESTNLKSLPWASRHGITMFTVAGVGAEEPILNLERPTL